ncbi:unnamed protein product [Larinioides sclopetarius]|uniref:Uncharacterized protein n=1 Tax=Larinioides sclopetarius TaxID=280406 RepID=A0AAV1Z6V6_9ARAC
MRRHCSIRRMLTTIRPSYSKLRSYSWSKRNLGASSSPSALGYLIHCSRNTYLPRLERCLIGIWMDCCRVLHEASLQIEII